MSKYKVNNQSHRIFVGNNWDSIGKLQFDFCVNQGLTPDMKLIDIGCGSLRAGTHFIRYMGNNYYGIDRHEQLINAGINIEAPMCNLVARRENFFVTKDFDLSPFNTKFNFGWCNSVFTHLPTRCIIECLTNTQPYFAPGATLYATIYITKGYSYQNELQTFNDRRQYVNTGPIQHDEESMSGLKTFCYNIRDIVKIFDSVKTMWECNILGDWNHPKEQQMLTFKKVL
jgi:SAM-dependent methyltransferase